METLTFLLFLWHGWRAAVWGARHQAAKAGAEIAVRIGSGERAWVRYAVYRLRAIHAAVMCDYHQRRERQLEEAAWWRAQVPVAVVSQADATRKQL